MQCNIMEKHSNQINTMMIDYGLRTFVSLKFAHIYGIYVNRL